MFHWNDMVIIFMGLILGPCCADSGSGRILLKGKSYRKGKANL